MLHPIAGKHLDASVIHAHRHADGKRPLGKFQSSSEVFVEIQRVSSLIELTNGQTKGRGIEFLHGILTRP